LPPLIRFEDNEFVTNRPPSEPPDTTRTPPNAAVRKMELSHCFR